MIRKALIPDVREIHRLLLDYARDGLLLSRSLAELYESLRDFYVFEVDGKVVGTAALNICWEDLAELRSLAVHPDFNGRGAGRELVLACLAEARLLGIRRVFALTYKQAFFDLIKQHRGRVVDSPGDNLLAEFASVVDAVQCAVAVQERFQETSF